MKSVKLLLAALFVVVCSVSGQEKLSSDSTQLFFDDNGELTRADQIGRASCRERV